MSENAFQWLVEHPGLVGAYAGEYIAIADDRIVAHGTDFGRVLEEAERVAEEPLIHKVPDPNKELVV